MSQKYVPLDKRSKRQQRDYHKLHRKDWGNLNPATKKTPNLKAYNRKKTGQWRDYEPCPVFVLRDYDFVS